MFSVARDRWHRQTHGGKTASKERVCAKLPNKQSVRATQQGVIHESKPSYLTKPAEFNDRAHF